MTRIRAIPIIQAAKVFGLTGFMLGAVSSCLGLLLIFLVSTETPVFTLTILISLPLLGALLGFAGTAAICWLYNANSGWFGGLLLELQEETVPAPGVAEEMSLSAEFPGLEEAEEAGLDREAQWDQPAVRVYRLKLRVPAKGQGQKDSSSFAAPVEWIDLRNDGTGGARTRGLYIYHAECVSPGADAEYHLVGALPESVLRPGEILRMHVGPRRELSALQVEARTGADRHAFTGREARLFGRREGDTVALYAIDKKQITDMASYNSGPPNGSVLLRRGPRLVAG